MDENESLQDHLVIQNQVKKKIKWKSPPCHWAKFNFDRVSRCNLHQYRASCIIKNLEGNLVIIALMKIKEGIKNEA